MTSDSEREQQLRRLLSEAVDPVQPAPGAQTRLLAKVRAQAHHRKSRRPLVLRLALPVTLACAVAIFVVTIAFATHGGDRSDSSASTASGATTSRSAEAAAPSKAALAPARPSAADASPPQVLNPAPNSPEPDLSKSTAAYGNSKTQSGVSGSASVGGRPVDLDGDGVPDTIGVQGENLVATLSKDGVQKVALPQPVGAGARVLGGTTLSDLNRKPVAVVFVRLTRDATAATDTMAAVVGGRLTVLRQGSDPVLLTIDPTHGYGCDQSSLAIAGDTTPFVVDGSRLVASPELRGVITPAAKVTGCF
jgi:hypothetical protein